MSRVDEPELYNEPPPPEQIVPIHTSKGYDVKLTPNELKSIHLYVEQNKPRIKDQPQNKLDLDAELQKQIDKAIVTSIEAFGQGKIASRREMIEFAKQNALRRVSIFLEGMLGATSGHENIHRVNKLQEKKTMNTLNIATDGAMLFAFPLFSSIFLFLLWHFGVLWLKERVGSTPNDSLSPPLKSPDYRKHKLQYNVGYGIWLILLLALSCASVYGHLLNSCRYNTKRTFDLSRLKASQKALHMSIICILTPIVLVLVYNHALYPRLQNFSSIARKVLSLLTFIVIFVFSSSLMYYLNWNIIRQKGYNDNDGCIIK